LRSLSGTRAQVIRRCGPIGPLSGVSGAAFTLPQATSPSPAAAARAPSSVRTGLEAASSARRARLRGVVASSPTPLATTPASLGSGSGLQSRSGGGNLVPSGARSYITVVRSAPDTPSTRQ
jgi:hypothetical protein